MGLPLINPFRRFSNRWRASRACQRDAIVLALFTLIAAAIRLTNLSRPALLPDDAFTFWRVCGSFRDMVETLRDDGFTPLHYEALWWLKQGCPLPGGWRVFADGLYPSPTMLRAWPTFCGTLMPMAMYFLGRQMLTRRASLIAAAITVCSAYMLWFSRDIKMYAPLWLFTTVGVASLLWWLRTRSVTAWLCWVAATQAAVGLHMTAMLVVALTPLFVLTSRTLGVKSVLLALLGLGIIGAGPAGYYAGFNKWTEKSGGVMPGTTGTVKPNTDWDLSGLGWLGRSPATPGEISSTAMTWATCFETPWRPERMPTWTYAGYINLSMTVVVVFVLIGTFPWPRRWLRRDGGDDDLATEPPWRVVLWLSSWMLLVGYGFYYCRSVSEPAFLNEIFWNDLLPLVAATWLLATAALLPFSTNRRRTLVNGLCVFASIAAVVGLCWVAREGMNAARAAAMARNPGLSWETIWHTRYVAIVWPAFVLAIAALLDRVPTWPLRTLAVGVFIAVNLVNGGRRIFHDTQYRFDLVWADVWQDRRDVPGDTLTFVGTGLGGPMPVPPYWRMVPAYYGVTTGRLHTTPPEFRTGKQWPFVYGSVFGEIRAKVNIRETSSLALVREEADASPAARRLIVWSDAVTGNGEWPTAIDGWRLVQENVYVAYWGWTWREQGRMRRCEYARDERSLTPETRP